MNRKLLYLGILTALVWILLFVFAFAGDVVPQPEGEKGKLVFMLVNLLLGSSLVPLVTNLVKKYVPILSGPGAIISSGVLGVGAAFATNWIFGAGLTADYVLLLGLGGNQTAASFMFEIYKTFFKKV